MPARMAIVWLVVLTLLLVGATLVVDAVQPRFQHRPAPVRTAPPASETPVLMADGALSAAPVRATIRCEATPVV